MQFPIILLALAATSSAIDILGFGGSTYVAEHCKNSDTIVVSWRGVQADTCYSSSTSLAAMQFVAIPKTWHIITRSYSALSCPSNTKLQDFHSNGNDQVCHGSAKGEIRYRGAGYSFEPTKRSEHNDSNDLENANETKQSCVGPDRVHLIDGQEYAVTGIEDTIVAEMVSLQADCPSKTNSLTVRYNLDEICLTNTIIHN